MVTTAVAPIVTSSIFFLVAIVLVAVFGSALVQYSSTLARLYEVRRQDIEASKTVAVIESVVNSGSCLVVNLANRGPSPFLISERTTILVDYTTTTGERLVKILQHGTSWFIEEVSVGNYRYSNSLPAVELKPGARVAIRLCADPPPDISKPVVIVVVGAYGVRAEYVYALG